MNKKTIFWLLTLALTAVPAFNAAAQEEPGPGFGDDEMEMNEPGPGQQPEMGPRGQMGQPGQRGGMKQGKGGMDQDQERVIVKKKMMMRGQMGGPGFLGEEEVLASIKKNDPEFGKKLLELQEMAPAKYKMVLQMGRKMLGMARMEQDESMEKDAVRGLSLEFTSKELSLKYNKASDAEKKAIKEQLKGVLSELFDLKSKGQEQRVKHMEGEIGRLKKNLESRKANKAKIVDQRLDQMTGEGFGW